MCIGIVSTYDVHICTMWESIQLVHLHTVSIYSTHTGTTHALEYMCASCQYHACTGTAYEQYSVYTGIVYASVQPTYWHSVPSPSYELVCCVNWYSVCISASCYSVQHAHVPPHVNWYSVHKIQWLICTSCALGQCVSKDGGWVGTVCTFSSTLLFTCVSLGH